MIMGVRQNDQPADSTSSHPADALHSGRIAEALALSIHTLRQIKHRVCGDKIPHWKEPEAVFQSRCFIGDHCDSALPMLEYIFDAYTQSQFEEPPLGGDEVDATSKSASLTQKGDPS